MNRSLKLALTEKSRLVESCRSLLLLIDATDGQGGRSRHQDPCSGGSSCTQPGDTDEDDDEAEFTSRLISNCETIFRRLVSRLDAVVTNQRALEAQLTALQKERASQAETSAALKAKLLQAQRDILSAQDVIQEKAKLLKTVEDQRHLIAEYETQIHNLRRRHAQPDTKKAENVPPRKWTRRSHRASSADTSHDGTWGNGASPLEEPLINVVSDGQQSVYDGGARQWSIWRSISGLCCCFRRRRRTDTPLDVKRDLERGASSSVHSPQLLIMKTQ